VLHFTLQQHVKSYKYTQDMLW